MQKEGASYLHYLAHQLTRDPREEIQGALEDAVRKSWVELHDDSGLEAEVRDVPVQVDGAGAQYVVQSAALPENYAQSYAVATGREDETPEMTYAFNPDVAWQEARETFEGEMDKRILAGIMHMDFFPMYPTVEMAERVRNYGISIGSLSFVLYDIKQHNF